MTRDQDFGYFNFTFNSKEGDAKLSSLEDRNAYDLYSMGYNCSSHVNSDEQHPDYWHIPSTK